MTDITRAIQQIEAVEQKIGVAELAREAAIPYTTLVGWKAHGWRPKGVATLEKLAAAAERRARDEAA
jgi:hypothetical protein